MRGHAPRCPHRRRAYLDGDDPLTRRRHAGVDRQRRRNPVARCQAQQAGGGQHERVELAGIELAQPRVEIAANRAGSGRPARAGATARCGARCWSRCAAHVRARASGSSTDCDACRATSRPEHDGVARILARQHGADLQARRAAPPACPCCCERPDRCCRSSSASSISLTNSRLPPISDSVASASRSPDVLMTTISVGCAGERRAAARRRRWPGRARARCRACRCAVESYA